jgi:hypothetical protein
MGSSNWMWFVILAAALGHALRWVPGDATARQLKIPAVFVVLYAAYAAVVARGGLVGLLIALLIVEILLQLYRRSRPERPASRGGDTTLGRRRR